MITITGRKLQVPQGERHIGFEGDNLVETRKFEITDANLFGMDFRVDIANTNETLLLEKQVNRDENKMVLTWDITASVVKNVPVLEFQLRGIEADGNRVWHSEKYSFYTSSSVNAEKQLEQEELSEFQALERQAQLYRNESESFSKQALTAKDEAVVAKNEAVVAKNEAVVAKNDAESAKNDAVTAKNEAQTYAQNCATQCEMLYGSVYTKEETDGLIGDEIAQVESKMLELPTYDSVYTIGDIDNLLADKANAGSVYTKEDSDKFLADKANADSVYTKTEVDEKLKKLSYEEEVKLTDVTTTEDNTGFANIYDDNSIVASSGANFVINIQGNIRFCCYTYFPDAKDGSVQFYVDGQYVVTKGYGEEFSFNSNVSQNIRIECDKIGVHFTEFVKVIPTKDVIDDIDNLLAKKANADSVYTKEDSDKFLADKANADSVYTKTEIDEKLKNLSYEEEVKLTDVTTIEDNSVSAVVGDDYLGGAKANFVINIQGNVRFQCRMFSVGGEARFYVDGQIDTVKGHEDEYSFDRYVSQNIRIECENIDVTFTEFVKVVPVKDVIGDIDTALDAILAIQAEYIGGDEA